MAEVSGVMIWEIGQDAFGANAAYSLLSAIDAIVTSSVSVADANSPHLRIFPNPVQHHLTIDLNGESPDRILVRDVQGRIWRDQMDAHSGIDASELPAGLYVLSVYSGNKLRTGKFLKV